MVSWGIANREIINFDTFLQEVEEAGCSLSAPVEGSDYCTVLRRRATVEYNLEHWRELVVGEAAQRKKVFGVEQERVAWTESYK